MDAFARSHDEPMHGGGTKFADRQLLARETEVSEFWKVLDISRLGFDAFNVVRPVKPGGNHLRCPRHEEVVRFDEDRRGLKGRNAAGIKQIAFATVAVAHDETSTSTVFGQ